MYIFLNQCQFDTLNNRYVYTNNQIMIHLLTQIKKSNLFEIQAISYVCSKY